MRITAVGDCGVDRYLSLGRDRPGGIARSLARGAEEAATAVQRVGAFPWED